MYWAASTALGTDKGPTGSWLITRFVVPAGVGWDCRGYREPEAIHPYLIGGAEAQAGGVDQFVAVNPENLLSIAFVGSVGFDHNFITVPPAAFDDEGLFWKILLTVVLVGFRVNGHIHVIGVEGDIARWREFSPGAPGFDANGEEVLAGGTFPPDRMRTICCPRLPITCAQCIRFP